MSDTENTRHTRTPYATDRNIDMNIYNYRENVQACDVAGARCRAGLQCVVCVCVYGFSSVQNKPKTCAGWLAACDAMRSSVVRDGFSEQVLQAVAVVAALAALNWR